MILKKNDLLIVERGEYSDFTYDGPLRLLIDTTREELEKGYLEDFNKNKDSDDWWEYGPHPEGFAAWLVKERKAEAVDCCVLHAGSYGDFALKSKKKEEG